jgi:hypothetical protein
MTPDTRPVTPIKKQIDLWHVTCGDKQQPFTNGQLALDLCNALIAEGHAPRLHVGTAFVAEWQECII